MIDEVCCRYRDELEELRSDKNRAQVRLPMIEMKTELACDTMFCIPFHTPIRSCRKHAQ